MDFSRRGLLGSLLALATAPAIFPFVKAKALSEVVDEKASESRLSMLAADFDGDTVVSGSFYRPYPLLRGMMSVTTSSSKNLLEKDPTFDEKTYILETDTYRVKISDGITPYSKLEYVDGEQ